MKKFFRYFNPIRHLGIRKYSVFWPFIITSMTYVLSEVFAIKIVNDPRIVGLYIIYIPVVYIIYFSFRFGIRGGLAVVLLTIFYYFYIIYTRNFQGPQLISAIETTLILGFTFAIVGYIIGWLKQRIDLLIENEADERRRLEAIFQQLPVGIIITNAKGTVVQINKKTSEILGKKIPLGIQVGKDTFVEYEQDGKYVSTVQTPLYQAIHFGKTSKDKEYNIKRPDGKKRTIRVNASVILNKKNKVIAAASIINDITSRKELEERKDDFVNMASHELKTPLTSMMLYIEGLALSLKKHDERRLQKTLSGIKQQAIRLQELVNSLLDVSRLQTGKLVFIKEDFRLDELIREAVDALQNTSDSKKIIFKNKIPHIVYGDRFRINQVLTNLLTNALKYSPDGKNIIVSVKSEKTNVTISVRDYGIGIAKEQQRKIFDRLYQVTDSESKTYPGLGMGLYISREIIKRHRGKIWVESEIGKGSTFFFTIPK